MLASVGELPTRGEWSYELKWDGIRLLCYVAADGVLLRTRNQNDASDRYPECQALTDAVDLRRLPAVVDAEVVAFNDSGVPNFGRLQQRAGKRGSGTPVGAELVSVHLAS
ncbi:MAG: hypothetical protein WAP35_04370 [Solirubrobacterales bacterium]